MLEELKQMRDIGPKRILVPGSVPRLILYGARQPALVRFLDGSSAASCCLGCEDRPCYCYSDKELSQSPMDGFPDDKIRQVCPSDAVVRDGPAGLPIIKSDDCIMCGICVARCPAGAIFIDPEKGAAVQAKTNDKFIEVSQIPDERIEKTRVAFAGVKREGTMLRESDPTVDIIAQRSEQALARSVRYPNILARNLLRTLGVNAATRRIGNNSMRMDLIQKTADGHPGLVEVEFGDEAILDVPRDILDDVAVMVARYGWARGEFHTIIVTDAIPNRRSEYWRIIADIKNIFPWVRILTISVLALMLAIWNQQKLTSPMCDCFYVDEKTKSYLEENIVKALGFRPNLTGGHARTNNWVEWVK